MFLLVCGFGISGIQGSGMNVACLWFLGEIWFSCMEAPMDESQKHAHPAPLKRRPRAEQISRVSGLRV